MKLHNTLLNQEDVHREAATYRLSMGMSHLQEHLCLLLVYILLIVAGGVQ